MFIGISGYATAGKDTFAVMLAEELFNINRKRYILMAYATELKMRVQRDFDLSYEQLWGNEKEEPDLRYIKGTSGEYWSPREILQKYGEFYRTIYYDFWVDHVFSLIGEKEYTNVILTDVRYYNEIIPIIERGGFIIRIERDIKKIKTNGHVSEALNSKSENIDFVIENNGTLDELRKAASDVVVALLNIKTKREVK